jgi:hypothetical protein
MTINTSGYLGINKTNPQNALHVVGNIELGEGTTSRSLYAYNAARTYYGQLELYNLATGDLSLTTTFDTGDITLTPGGNVVVSGGGLNMSDNWANIYGENLKIWGNNDSDIYLQSDAGAGDVGIGTASPTGKLEIKGDDVATVISTDDTTGPNGKLQFKLAGLANSPFLEMQMYAPSGAGSEYFRFNIHNSDGNTYTDVLDINRLGYVGIGTSGPTHKLEIYGDESSNYIAHIKNDNATAGHGLFITSDGTSTDTDLLRIDSGGDQKFLVRGDGAIYAGNIYTEGSSVQVNSLGSGDRYAYVDLIGDDTYTDYGLRIIRFNTGSNASSSIAHRGTGNLAINTIEAAPIFFSTNNTERLRITSTGNVGIGTTSDYGGLNSKTIIQPGSGTGTTLMVNTYGNSGTAQTFYSNISGNPNAAGSITLSGATTAYNSTSDQRLKENIIPTSLNLDTLMNVSVRDFNFISDPTQNYSGFIAQELYDIYPDAVYVGSSDPTQDPWAVSYGRITPLVVAGVQELAETVNDQQTQIEQINSNIDILESSFGETGYNDLLTRIENLEKLYNSEQDTPEQIDVAKVLQLTQTESGDIEILGGKIIFEGDGTLAIRKLKVEENYTAGTGTILGTQTKVKIETKAVTKNSKILLTPRTKTEKQQLYTTNIVEEESFYVNIEEAIDSDITFDWFIVDTHKVTQTNLSE